jgi:hypothetical protein
MQVGAAWQGKEGCYSQRQEVAVRRALCSEVVVVVTRQLGEDLNSKEVGRRCQAGQVGGRTLPQGVWVELCCLALPV